MELWKPVVGFEGYYEVSNYGNVRSLARVVNHGKPGYTRMIYGRLLTPVVNKKRGNYLYTHLKLNNQETTKSVHRVVAEAWIPNPNNLPQVNHKDFDVSNNRVENLEWCDESYNVNYSLHRRRDMKGMWGRKIQAFDRDGKLVGEYGSVRQAARELNCFGQNISSVLNGKGKWVKGYSFKDVEK